MHGLTTDRRATGRVVGDAMLLRPKTSDVRTATTADVAGMLADDHVHMVLLVEGDRLVGTVVRDDLAAAGPASSPARAVARLEGRTVSPTDDLDVVHRDLALTGTRRLAVVDADLTLRGLLCLKRRQDGWCDDAGVAARARERRDDLLG